MPGSIQGVPDGDDAAWNSVIRWALSRLEWYRVDYPVDPHCCFHDSAPVRYGYAELPGMPGIQRRRCRSRIILEGPASEQAIELLARLCAYPFDDEHYIDPGESLMSFFLTTVDGAIVELRYFHWLLIDPSSEVVESELVELIADAGTKPREVEWPRRNLGR